MNRVRSTLPISRLAVACAIVAFAAGWTPAQETTVDPLTGAVTAREKAAPAEAEEAAVPRADLSEANDLVRARDYAGAQTALAALQEEYPDDPALLIMHGEVLLALGRAGEALPLLRHCIELDPARPRANFDLGAALASTGDRPGAIEAFGKELAVEDADPAVVVNSRLNRAFLMQQERRWDDAAGELDAVLALEPGRREVYGELANVYLEAGRLEDVARVLDRGLDDGFRSANHFYTLGAHYYRKKSFGPAVEALRRAVELDPQLASAQRSLAAALEQLGKDEEAVQHLRRYLELRPDAPDAKQVSERIAAAGG